MYRACEALLDGALDAAVASGDLIGPIGQIGFNRPACRLEPPEHGTFGDATSRVAMTIARRLGRPADEVARRIVRHVADPHGWLDRVEAAGPGFVNFHVSLDFWRAALAAQMEPTPAPAPTRGRALVVIAAPFGVPATDRAELVADAIGRCLRATGHDVEHRSQPIDAIATHAEAEDVARVAVLHPLGEPSAARRAKQAFAEAGGRAGRLTAIGVSPVEVRHRGRPVDGSEAARVLREPAARFALAGTPAEVTAVLDAERLATDRVDNPWTGVRYALARIRRVAPFCGPSGALDALGDAERECLRAVGMHPDAVELAARRLEPEGLVAYAQTLAMAFHRYYNRGGFLGGDATDARARRVLACGVGRALEATLALLGLADAEQG